MISVNIKLLNANTSIIHFFDSEIEAQAYLLGFREIVAAAGLKVEWIKMNGKKL